MEEQTAGDDNVDFFNAFGEPGVNSHIVGCDGTVECDGDGTNWAQWMGSHYI